MYIIIIIIIIIIKSHHDLDVDIINLEWMGFGIVLVFFFMHTNNILVFPSIVPSLSKYDFVVPGIYTLLTSVSWLVYRDTQKTTFQEVSRDTPMSGITDSLRIPFIGYGLVLGNLMIFLY